MMTLQDFIKSTDFDSFWPVLRDTYLQTDTFETRKYTDEEKEKIGKIYRKCYNNMQELVPCAYNKDKTITAIKIFDIDHGTEDGKNGIETERVDVSAYDYKTDEFYGIEFTEWTELLGYNICKLSIDKYGAAECMAHILWELTFFGVDPEDVSRERAKLDKAIREIEEGDTSNYQSWDDLKKELGLDTPEETEEEIAARRAILNQLNEKNTNIKKEFSDFILASSGK